MTAVTFTANAVLDQVEKVVKAAAIKGQHTPELELLAMIATLLVLQIKQQQEPP